MKIVNEGTDNSFAIIERDTHMSKWAQQHNRLDFDKNSLPKYIELFTDGGVFVNVGANIGCYAKPFVRKASKVICFEPHPEAFECLQYNLGKYNNVELYNTALSNYNKPFEVIDGHANNVGASKIRESIASDRETLTLDSFDLERLDFILMDCEGSEYDIILGASNTINKFKPIIASEVNDGHLKRFGANQDMLFKAINDLGYDIKNVIEENGLDGTQFDVICFPLGEK